MMNGIKQGQHLDSAFPKGINIAYIAQLKQIWNNNVEDRRLTHFRVIGLYGPLLKVTWKGH